MASSPTSVRWTIQHTNKPWELIIISVIRLLTYLPSSLKLPEYSVCCTCNVQGFQLNLVGKRGKSTLPHLTIYGSLNSGFLISALSNYSWNAFIKLTEKVVAHNRWKSPLLGLPLEWVIHATLPLILSLELTKLTSYFYGIKHIHCTLPVSWTPNAPHNSSSNSSTCKPGSV